MAPHSLSLEDLTRHGRAGSNVNSSMSSVAKRGIEPAHKTGPALSSQLQDPRASAQLKALCVWGAFSDGSAELRLTRPKEPDAAAKVFRSLESGDDGHCSWKLTT